TAAVTGALRSFLQRPAREDIVILYFACHGSPDPNRPQNLYLLTYDADTGFVYSVAFSPDGTRMATASGDETARLWNATTGELLAVLPGAARSVVFFLDGRHLATAGGNTARIWA